MNFTTLFDILAAHPDDADACALAVVKAANGSMPHELLNAFSVALGAGKINPSFARALLAALERFQLDADLCARATEEDPTLAELRREIEALTARREELKHRDGALAEQREKARRLTSAFDEARVRKETLAAEVVELREQYGRADALAAEETT